MVGTFFELGFITLIWILWVRGLSWHLEFKRIFLVELMATLIAGFAIWGMAGIFGIPIPFNLESRELIVWLLLLGPILEELLFRVALWEIIARLHPRAAWSGTSLLFSLGHFFIFWVVVK